MFSIKIDNDIHKGIDLISIDFLIPHEEVLLDKKEILKNNLKYKDQSVIISSIIVCHESFIIIDGHHRFTALDRKSTRLNSSHSQQSRMPSSA